ncbi:hypothetical protein [Pseudomonas nitroreducens]|uniref:hypothetical protein n=1 Tax=Pseudomonas nitroreducens TaxID=46680 RepID=UPI003CC81391
MSAQIIPFPGSANNASTQALRTMVEVDQMHAFRVLGVSALREFSGAQHVLVSLIRAYEASGTAPRLEELEELSRMYGGVLQCIDFADKFLVVHGEPVADADNYEVLRSKYRREISHQSTARDVCLSKLIRGLDDE